MKPISLLPKPPPSFFFSFYLFSTFFIDAPSTTSMNTPPLIPPLLPSKEADHLSSLLFHHHNPLHPALSHHHLLRYTISLPLLHQTLLRLRPFSKLLFSLFTFSLSFPHLHPSLSSLAILLHSFTNSHHFHFLWHLLLHSPHPSLFPILFRRLISAGLTRQAVRAFDDFHSLTNSPPSLPLFSSLLDTLCKHNRPHLATELLNSRSSVFPPDSKLYTLLVYGWCRIKRLDVARRLLEEMEFKGIQPNIVTYNVILNGICRRASLHPDLRFSSVLRSADQLFDEMSAKGLKPDVTTHSIVLHLYSRAHKDELCLEKMNDLKKKGVCLSVAGYTSVIKCLCSCGRMGEAEDLLAEMEEKGVEANGETYNCFLKEYRGRGDRIGALRMYRGLRKKGVLGVRSCNILLVMFERMGEDEVVEEIWEDMGENGVGYDLDSYTLLVHGLCRRGRLVRACEVFVEMVEKGAWPQKKTCKLLYKRLREGGMLWIWKKVKRRMEEEDARFREEFAEYCIRPFKR